MIKIVYFDEDSATDYLDIKHGGNSQTTGEEVDEKAKKALARLETQAGAGLKFLHVLKGAFSAEANGEITKQGTKVLKNTFTTTVLTDFVSETKDGRSEDITVFRDYRLMAKKDSFAFAKMYTPYTVLLKDDIDHINISKLDEALEHAKGYYELIGIKNNNKVVLRFNIDAFRNNYGLTDLIKMDLNYYAIQVGECLEDDLLMEKEMSEETKEPNKLSAMDIFEGKCPENPYLKVYDVILAGVGTDLNE
ncbi:DUF6414 family protein [Lentibacillus sp. CBA3610]|uniref:DUF6414 family protein n=1 Tax=Lentibacillus sp. CBA3610 TaxID=2518176 RepID=UPI00159514E8|nr:DUF6414 family protein [Lentibacillus sp. CBA3610]QKY71310.1 hypothetical protein Len3610_18700 [Lentibacillus sp. CBA3610]